MRLWQMIVCGAQSEVGSLSVNSTTSLNVMMAYEKGHRARLSCCLLAPH
jgi:hypothetical protein